MFKCNITYFRRLLVVLLVPSVPIYILMSNIRSFVVLSGLLVELYLKEGILLILSRYVLVSCSSSFCVFFE